MLKKFIIFSIFILISLFTTSAEAEEEPLYLNADSVRIEELKVLVATGNVILKYKDMEVTADRLELDLKENKLKAWGNVILQQGEVKTEGEELDLDLKSKYGVVIKPYGEVKGPKIKGTIYWQGKKMKGTQKKIGIERGSMTTCDNTIPHYHISARRVTVYPGDRVVIFWATFWDGVVPIFFVPYYVISLKEERDRTSLPRIGHNETEGWFIKAAFDYFITTTAYGIIYLDWMEKIGLGEGFRHYYTVGEGGKGSLYFYHLANKVTDRSEITSQLKHEQTLGDFKTSLSLNHNNTNKSLQAVLSINRQVKGVTTTLTNNYNITQMGTPSELKNISTRLYHTQLLPASLRADALINYSAYDKSENKVDEELKYALRLSRAFRGFGLELYTEKREDLDRDLYTGDDNLIVLDKIPELTLDVTQRSLKGLPIFYKTKAHWGRYHYEPGDIYLDRIHYELTVRENFRLKLPKPFRDMNFNFLELLDQSLYSNGDKRYLFKGQVIFLTGVSEYLDFNLTYTYQQVEGETPIPRLDKVGTSVETLLIKNDLRYKDIWKLSVYTTYNFKTEEYSDLIAKMQTKPKEKLRIDLGLSYDIEERTFKRLDAMLDIGLIPKWQLEYRIAYDLINGRPTFGELIITHDLHCREIKIGYIQTKDEFWLEYRIKAFPGYPLKIGGGDKLTVGLPIED